MLNERLTHGGDLESAQENHRGTILDFSVNLNPLGMPPAVAQAARRGVEESVRYPDPQCRELKRALARREGVKPEQIICGNGAAELLFRLTLVLRPRRGLVIAPSFGEYERALRGTDCSLRRHLLRPEGNFDLDEGLLEDLAWEPDLVLLCNPNNPTGRLADPGLLAECVRRCEREGIWLLVDESFLELTTGGPPQGLLPLMRKCPHLLLLRSLTKSYAMPGLRLGYLLTAHGGLARALEDCGQPWPVSLPAQRAGVAACALPDWPAQGRRVIARERPILQENLRERGYTVWESAVNYLLFRAPGEPQLQRKLLERGILLRNCASFHPLGEDYYRVAVRTGPENERLLAALRTL